MIENELLKSEIDLRKFTLTVHDQNNRKGLSNNHVMANFNGNITPTMDFINSWEMNAKIFKNQILKYLNKCKTEDERKYILKKSTEAYEILADEHHNLAVLSRNVPNNPLMVMTHKYEEHEESEKDIMKRIENGIKPKPKEDKE